MGRKSGLPGYCLHRASGRAVARVGGKDVYLGVFGTPESRRRYGELIARLQAGAPAEPPGRDLCVAELIRRYDDFASAYYVKDKKPTRQLERVRRSLGLAVELYGSTPAGRFGPTALEAVRNRMVALDWSRKHVNSCVGCVRRAWRWAASKELVTASVYESLRTLDGLRAGRTEARETAPIGPVTGDAVEATLSCLRPETADMVRLQLLTAMRAGEVCALRACEIDRSGDVWLWRPADHKTRHAGKSRLVLFGPRAQTVLAPHLAVCGDGYVFSPERTMAALRQQQHQAKRRKFIPAEIPTGENRRKNTKARSAAAPPKRPPGEFYTSNSYQKAIRSACDAAGVPRWTSHQLRHSAATAIRAAFGLEAVQAVLGHSRVETSQIYADRHLALALEAMREAG